MKPNMVGFFQHYDTPNLVTEIDSTAVAAIDYSNTAADHFPYAHSGTVKEEHDNMTITSWNTAVTIPANSKHCYGLFLASEEDLDSDFMFNCHASFTGWSNQDHVQPFAIFGNTNSSTVTNSIVSAQNETDNFIYLPIKGVGLTNNGVSPNWYVSERVVTFNRGTTPYVFAFGFANSTASTETMNGQLSLSFYKYRVNSEVFRPSGN